MACRIDRVLTDRDSVVLRVSGRIAADDVEVLRAAMDEEPSAFAIDLKDVGLVDREVVTLLAFIEATGVEIRNCPPYIREWIEREREQP